MVPLGLPDTLALGAAIGALHSLMNAFAILLLGILTPTVSSLADTISGIIFFFFNINVNGPRHKFIY